MAAEALCCLEWDSSKPSEVLWRSRGGGTKARPTGGSVTYKIDLGLLLQRAGDMGLQLKRVAVDTRTTGHLSLAQRTIRLDPAEVPGGAMKANGVIQLSRLGPGGADALRARLGTRAAKVGRPPGARGGGNTTKTLRLYFTRGLKRAEVLRLDAPPRRGELVRNPEGHSVLAAVGTGFVGLLGGALVAKGIQALLADEPR
jgi:hypothetical protein